MGKVGYVYHVVLWLKITLKNVQLITWKMICLPGYPLKNSLKPLVIGHWASSGVIVEGCCNLQGENASNIFPCKSFSSELAIIPVELAATIIRISSFEGQWVLDLMRSNGEFNYLSTYPRWNQESGTLSICCHLEVTIKGIFQRVKIKQVKKPMQTWLTELKDEKYIWNNSYLYCGCRWEWRVIIVVNFPI